MLASQTENYSNSDISCVTKHAANSALQVITSATFWKETDGFFIPADEITTGAIQMTFIAHCIIVDPPFKLDDFGNQNLWDQLH